MKTRLTGIFLVGLTFASVGVAVGGDAKSELKKFAGAWAVESLRDRGKDAPAEEAQKATFIFSGDKITIEFQEGGKTDKLEGTFKIDPSKKPGHIDLDVAGKKATGIYAFEG